MTRLMGLCVTVLALTAALGCGKSEAEKQAEQAAADMKQAAGALAEAADKASDATAGGAEDFAAAMKGMAGALAGAADAANGGKAVDPVSFRDLQNLLPAASNWTMNKPTGERMTAPVPFSQTEASYTNGDERVDVTIVDSGFHQILIAPWSMFLASGYERETDSGYEKAVDIGGTPGFEKWDTDAGTGELNLLVGKRYLVTIEGRRVSDPKTLQEFAANLDAARLAALK